MITRRDMTAYTIGLLIGSILTFFSIKSHAYEINVYQAESSKYDSVVEVVNDCGKIHRLVLQTKNVRPDNEQLNKWVMKVLDICQ